MALSPSEMQGARDYAQKLKQGDKQAEMFWTSIKSQASGAQGVQGIARAKEFLNVLEMYEMETGTGLTVDASLVEKLGLNAQQVRDCKEVTMRFVKGDQQAIAFFNGCERGMNAGNPASAGMLTLRDEILKSMGKNNSGATIPESVQKGIPPQDVMRAAGASEEAIRAIAVGSRAAAAESGEGLPVVTSLPPLDEAGLAVIEQACKRGHPFAAGAVLDLVSEIRELHAVLQTGLPSELATGEAPSVTHSPNGGHSTTP